MKVNDPSLAAPGGAAVAAHNASSSVNGAVSASESKPVRLGATPPYVTSDGLVGHGMEVLGSAGSEPNGGQGDRADILCGWQKTSAETLNKLLLLTSIVTFFYVYYALMSPILVANRQRRLRDANQDLVRITWQFKMLRARYKAFVMPTSSPAVHQASDMRRIQDMIAPATHQHLTTRASNSTKEELQEKLRALRALSDSMGILTTLYNDYHNRPVIPSYDLEENSIGQSLTDSSSTRENGSRTPVLTEDGPNNPLCDLSRLMVLEDQIKVLTQFAGSTLNFELCEDARSALSLRCTDCSEIHLGSSLMESFPPYSELQQYTPLTGPLKFEPKLGLESYEAIKEYVGAPFEVKSIADLARLNLHLGGVIDQTVADYQSPILTLPLISTNIDRFFILTIVPLAVSFLTWIIDYYVKRSVGLIQRICSDYPTLLGHTDFQRYAPFVPATWAVRLSLIFVVIVTATFFCNTIFGGSHFGTGEQIALVLVGVVSSVSIWYEFRLVLPTLRTIDNRGIGET